MLNIKKYANGRFFNTDKKKYIKAEELSELIQKGEEIKVTLTKTGEDITADILAQFAKKGTDKKAEKTIKKEIPFIKTDKLVKWVGEIIDARINHVLEIVKLPSKEQVAHLDENIQALNKKIDALNLAVEKKAAKKTRAKKKTKAADKQIVKEAIETKAPVFEKQEPAKTDSIKEAEPSELAAEKNAPTETAGV
jgi:polyhydroxyalkanoate synthesis regulator protein